jgi:precorrin-2 dehydrogenase/sirohydrochlorin ferrochelatase
MRYLPILVDLAGRGCLVVGGGAVASRKAETLLDAGARVVVVALRFDESLARRAETTPELDLVHRAYRPSDLDGVVVAFAATDDPELQERVSRDARAAGVLVNAVDDPERCSFVMPAILDRSPLVIAVSTSGESPALARRVRDDVDRALGREYDAALARLATLRRRFAPGRARQEAFVRLLDGGLLDALRHGDEGRVEDLIHGACAALPERDASVAGDLR